MIIIVKQIDKKHDVNQLHDELIKAGLNPWPVESTETESRFTFDDSADGAKVQAIVDGYTYMAPVAAPSTSDIIQALAQMDLAKASTLEDLKAQIVPVAAAAVKVAEAEKG
ncbi:MAG: hypothetical protein M3362_09920 [Acidobacteriota bacterium]|nr:hypothetical protein [Acidobacteriota bacterium]